MTLQNARQAVQKVLGDNLLAKSSEPAGFTADEWATSGPEWAEEEFSWADASWQEQEWSEDAWHGNAGCFRCGDPRHEIAQCPHPPKGKPDTRFKGKGYGAPGRSAVPGRGKGGQGKGKPFSTKSKSSPTLGYQAGKPSGKTTCATGKTGFSKGERHRKSGRLTQENNRMRSQLTTIAGGRGTASGLRLLTGARAPRRMKTQTRSLRGLLRQSTLTQTNRRVRHRGKGHRDCHPKKRSNYTRSQHDCSTTSLRTYALSENEGCQNGLVLHPLPPLRQHPGRSSCAAVARLADRSLQ